MPRHLIVVASDDTRLYAYLLDRFFDDDNVVVILDRRSGVDRRVRQRGPHDGTERRRGPDRRTGTQAAEDLRVQKYTIVSGEDSASR